MSNARTTIFDSAPGGRALAGTGAPAWSRLRTQLHVWLHGALPQLCALCAAPAGPRLLCAACADALPRIGKVCPGCALPTPEGRACAACRERPPPWRHAVAAFAYAYPLDRLLHALKYRGATAYAPLFAGALVERLLHDAPTPPDALVALPLSPARQRDRGYNQAIEIARPLARTLGLPLVTGLRRTRDTPPLAGLPWRERQRLVNHAFAADPCVAGRAVALVDDVLTTGATLRAATRALHAAGAASVDVWVVARTLPPSS